MSQVFLRVSWPTDKMVEYVLGRKANRVLEIGPGGGVLTKPLLQAGLDVTCVEADKRFADHLKGSLGSQANLKIINQDVLTFDLGSWLGEQQAESLVIGNIPYHISSPIVQWYLQEKKQCLGAVFLTQLEFAKRVCASPGNKDYGSLSVFVQLRADPKYLFKVGKECFKPVPKVDSGVVAIEPASHMWPEEILAKAETICRQAFSQRRKILSNSLKPFLQGQDLSDFPIDLQARPETLSPAQFIELATRLLQGVQA